MKPLIPQESWHCKHRVNGVGHPNCWREYLSLYATRDMKIGYLDLECNGLQGDFNWIYSYAIKTRGKDEVFSKTMDVPDDIVDMTFDRNVTASLIEHMRLYDMVITYYGTGFDLPMARTRALHWGLDFPAYGEILHHDLYYLVKSKLLLHSNRLAAVTEALGVEDKTPLKPSIWQEAMASPKAMQYILKHNIQDVIVLEQVHNKLLKFAKGGRRSI